MSLDPDKLCNDWNAQEFYHLVRYLAWEADAQKRYSDLIAQKHKK